MEIRSNNDVQAYDSSGSTFQIAESESDNSVKSKGLYFDRNPGLDVEVSGGVHCELAVKAEHRFMQECIASFTLQVFTTMDAAQ